MASEVVSASGVSVSGGSGLLVSSSGGSVAAAPIRTDQTIKPTPRQDRAIREGSGVVPQQPLSSYESIYTNDKNQYDGFMQESDKRFADKLTVEQRHSLRHYKGDGYIRLNQELRGMASPTKKQQAHIKELDAAFEGHELGRNIVSYRGFSAHITHEVGKVYTDKGFMSSSLNPNNAFGGQIFLKIHASKKAKAAFIDSKRVYNGYEKSVLYSHEHEVLFARGTRYQVVGKSKVKLLHGEKEAFDVVILE